MTTEAVEHRVETGGTGTEAPCGRRAPPSVAAAARIAVIGLGNPLLGDDAVGWAVLDVLERRLPPDSPVDLDRLAVGGLTLMERLVGLERAVLVDAITGDGPPGTVLRLSLEDLGRTHGTHLDNAHDATLSLALAIGRAMGARLPERIEVVAVAIEPTDAFAEGLSPEVAAALDPAAEVVLELLGIAASV